MKGKKGSLKNTMKEWQLHEQYENIEEQKIQEENVKKNSEFVTLQSVTEKGQKGLKNIFGTLFGFLENISIDKKHNNQKNSLNDQEKYIYKQVELENMSLYEQDDIVEDKDIVESDVVVDTEEKSTTTDKQAELLAIMSKPHENKYIVNFEHEDENNNIKEQPTYEEIADTSLLDGVKSITVEINILHNKLNRIIDSDKNLKNKREDILVVKGRVQELKDRYYETIAPNKDFIKNLDEQIDPYNLHLSPKEMNNILQRCDTELSKIKKQNKQIKENNSIVSDNEFEQIKAIIEDNLKEQIHDIDELKKEFNEAEIKNKRSTLITGIHDFLSKTINIGISLLPNTICKNKTAGMLGSTIVLNNRLRSMRKIIRKENNNINYMTYNDILEKIKNEKLCIEKTKEVLEDAMHQLQNLKQEFIMEFYYDMDRYSESDDIMTEFTSIEYQITSKSSELEDIIETIEEI